MAGLFIEHLDAPRSLETTVSQGEKLQLIDQSCEIIILGPKINEKVLTILLQVET